MMKESPSRRDATVYIPRRKRSPFVFIVTAVAAVIVIVSSLFIAVPAFARELRLAHGMTLSSFLWPVGSGESGGQIEADEPLLLDAAYTAQGYSVVASADTFSAAGAKTVTIPDSISVAASVPVDSSDAASGTADAAVTVVTTISVTTNPTTEQDTDAISDATTSQNSGTSVLERGKKSAASEWSEEAEEAGEAGESENDADVTIGGAFSRFGADDVLAIVFLVILLGMGMVAVANKKRGYPAHFDHARQTVIRGR